MYQATRGTLSDLPVIKIDNVAPSRGWLHKWGKEVWQYDMVAEKGHPPAPPTIGGRQGKAGGRLYFKGGRSGRYLAAAIIFEGGHAFCFCGCLKLCCLLLHAASSCCY